VTEALRFSLSVIRMFVGVCVCGACVSCVCPVECLGYVGYAGYAGYAGYVFVGVGERVLYVH
jgi:hypothetical protein